MSPRTPILRPREYFESHGFDLGPAATAVGAATLSLVVALAGFGVLLARRLAADGYGDAAGAVWGPLAGYLFTVVIGMAIGWLLAAAVLHLLARAVVGHDGDFLQTLAIVGWGTAPTVLTSLVAFVLIAAALGDATMASPEAFADQFRANVRRGSALSHVVAFLVAGWQTYLYANGLAVAFGDTDDVWLVAGVVAVGGWLLSVV